MSGPDYSSRKPFQVRFRAAGLRITAADKTDA